MAGWLRSLSSNCNIVDGLSRSCRLVAAGVNKIEAKRRVSFISHIARGWLGRGPVTRDWETGARMTEQPAGCWVGGPAPCHNARLPATLTAFLGDLERSSSPARGTVTVLCLSAVCDRKRRRLGHVRIASWIMHHSFRYQLSCSSVWVIVTRVPLISSGYYTGGPLIRPPRDILVPLSN